MPRRRRRPSKRAIEVRRLTFRVSTPLETSGIPGAGRYALGGDEYRVPPDDYDDFVRAMKRAGYEVQTVRSLYYELPYVQYEPIRSGFWYRTQRDYPGSWYYLSPLSRRWKPLPTDGNRLVLRNGWALCRFAQGSHYPTYYYLEQGKDLDECQCSGDKAIFCAYSGVLGTLPVPHWSDRDYLYVPWPAYVIPKEHQRFLTEHLSPLENKLEIEQGELWVWRQADHELIENCLRGLHFSLREWSAGDDWIPTLSAVFKRSYKTYLSKREGLATFADLIRRRAWHEVEDEALRRILEHLGSTEFDGDATSARVLNFLTEKVAVAVGWREHPHEDVCGLVLESSPVLYYGRETGRNYYRLVLPDLEVVTGWTTKIMRQWNSPRLPSVKISKWRVLPYLGRMRTAPQAKAECTFPQRSDIDLACRAILGIPKVEWDLAEKACMDAFSLDLDPRHWYGYNDLMRYAAAYAQVVTHNPMECDTPGLLLEDMLGFRFVLRVTGLTKQDWPMTNEWVRYIGRTNLSDCGTAPMPIFTLVAPHLLVSVTQAEALHFTLLSAVKYHFGVTVKELGLLFKGTPLAGIARRAMDKLTETGDVVLIRRRYYYRYGMATPEQLTHYVTAREAERFDLPFGLLRDVLHPLSPRASHLFDETGRLLQAPGRIWRVYVTDREDSDLVGTALQHLQDKGAVGVSGRGPRRSERASTIADAVVGNFRPGELLIRRQDSQYCIKNGDEIPQRDYVLLYPARILQRKFEGVDNCALRS